MRFSPFWLKMRMPDNIVTAGRTDEDGGGRGIGDLGAPGGSIVVLGKVPVGLRR
jgi:hypothetical protein